MVAAAELGGERSAWLVFGLLSSIGVLLAYAEEGVEVKVGSGDTSRSPLLALRRLNRPAVLWLSVRPGEGDIRDRTGEMMLDAMRLLDGEASGDLARLRCCSACTIVRSPDDPE